MPIRRGPQGRVKSPKKPKNPKIQGKKPKNPKFPGKNLKKPKKSLIEIIPKNQISCKIYPKIFKNPLYTYLKLLNFFNFLYPYYPNFP